jgi:hypothetical protein
MPGSSNLIKAICVSSANDAAVAVAELVGGSEPGFVQMMNARAAELGMVNTTFHNACGLDTEGHLSTAHDVAIMSREILNTCPEVLHYTGIWTDTLRGGATQLVNTNKLLKRYNGITGLKTGTTSGAGVCISASATRDGLDLIAVVLGSLSSSERFTAATTLLDYGFAAYAAVPLHWCIHCRQSLSLLQFPDKRSGLSALHFSEVQYEDGIVLLLTMYGLKADGVRDGKLVEEFEEAQTAGVIIDSLVIGKELGDETAVREIIVGTYAVVLDSGLGVNYEHQLSDATLVHGAHFLLSGRAARHDVINLASGIIDHKTMESLSHGDVAKV